MNFNNLVEKLLKSDLFGRSLKVLLIRISGVFLLFLMSMYLTNNYSPHHVGQYDFARSILMIIGGFSVLGTNQSIIFYSGTFKSQETLGSIKKVYFKMLGLIISACSVMLLIKLMLPNEMINSFFGKLEASHLVDKVVYSMSLYAITLLNIDMIRALDKTLLSELFRNIFRYLPFFIIAIYLVYSGNESHLVNAYLLSFSILVVTSFIVIFRVVYSTELEIKSTGPTFKNIFSKSFPMAISALSYFLMQSVDILLLTKYSTFEQVAFYSIAVKLSTITALALLSVNIIIAPKIAEMFANGENNKLKTLLQNSNRLILSLTFPVIAILAMFSNWILGLFGQDYVLAQSALLILLFGQLFSALCGPLGVYMNMTGKQKKLQRLLIFGLFLNVVLNIVSIPRYGMVGAAASTAFSMIVWKVLAVIITYRKDKVKTFIS